MPGGNSSLQLFGGYGGEEDDRFGGKKNTQAPKQMPKEEEAKQEDSAFGMGMGMGQE